MGVLTSASRCCCSWRRLASTAKLLRRSIANTCLPLPFSLLALLEAPAEGTVPLAVLLQSWQGENQRSGQRQTRINGGWMGLRRRATNS